MNDAAKPKTGRWIVLLVLIGVLFGVWTQAQAIQDAIRLHGYEPPAEVAALARDTTLSATATKLFYVNHPVVADRADFNQYCSSRGEQTIVLGCYHSKDRGIYLFDVTDQRLNGVEQVTAAHEMLHAAYDRLLSSERRRIDGLLQTYYQNEVKDERLRQTIAAYQKTEPNDIPNEMHSIFATEVETLPAELETYYRQYFADRRAVVRYAAQYQQEFTARRERVATYDQRLSDLKDQMDGNRTALDRQEVQIQAARRELEAYRSGGDIAGYNEAVPAFNQQIQSYNSLIATTQAQIRQYNALVAERNEVALEVKALAASISSQLTPLGQ